MLDLKKVALRGKMLENQSVQLLVEKKEIMMVDLKGKKMVEY
jgi:hypothetical protein